MEQLKVILNQQETHDLIGLFSELAAEKNWDELLVLFRLLNKDLSLEVFEQLSLEMQEKLIQAFTDEKAIEIVLGMEPDDRALLIEKAFSSDIIIVFSLMWALFAAVLLTTRDYRL